MALIIYVYIKKVTIEPLLLKTDSSLAKELVSAVDADLIWVSRYSLKQKCSGDSFSFQFFFLVHK